MANIFNAVAVFLGLALAVPSQAAFHLWTMNELYSNADGTIQFLEMTAITGGQQFLAGHELGTIGPSGAERTFIFPSDLPGDTTGRRMLIATQGFAALGIVNPDYVVPNGFFFPGGGSVSFAGADFWIHGALPADNRSIDRSGTAGAPSPTNFFGVTGVITIASPLNFQGLWWRGDSEAGWGVNVAHQGDILFVTWFTYDTDGSQMWLVAPDVRRTTGDTYTGPIYRTTGPAFNSNPFNPAQIAFVAVGTVSFTFADNTTGVFNYTVNNVSQSKPITRQVFSPVTPTCTAGGSQSAVLNFQDLWYAGEGERGWGANITHQGEVLFVTWFTYDAAGRGMWIVGPSVTRTSGNVFRGQLFRTTVGPAFSAVPWSPTVVRFVVVGDATFTFANADNGTFTYTVDGSAGSKSIVRQSFGTPATVCRN